jgi:sugar phosphate isomerase/epimerase
MKIACSSATFSREIQSGALTQLDWLDLCANELEVDGVVFDAAHFPRRDAEYLAQLKKVATDLGLTVAAFASHDAFGTNGEADLDGALALGAPLAIVHAPAESGDPEAWGAFTDALKRRAGDGKRLGVTLGPAPADLRRAAKDVDSAWLRFAYDVGAASDDEARVLTKSVIAMQSVGDAGTFATTGDRIAPLAIERLRRFRGFVVLEGSADAAEPTAYHHAVARFATLRSHALANDISVA